MADRRLWKKTYANGVVIKAPEPMTKAEWKEYKASPKGQKAIRIAEKTDKIRGTPTWTHWRSVYGSADTESIDKKAGGDLSRKKAAKDVGTADKCQIEGGIAPSYRTHFKGNWWTFKRVAIFPRTPHGKKLAEEQAERIRNGEGFRRDIHTSEKNKSLDEDTSDNNIMTVSDYEVDRQVRVLLVHCRDTPIPAKYWTVWVGRSMSPTEGGSQTRLATGRDELRTDAGYRSGLSGETRSKKGYHSGGTANVRSIPCPKCNAPSGENCTGKYDYEEAMKLYEEGELTRRQVKSGNPHRARINAYTEMKQQEDNENGEEI